MTFAGAFAEGWLGAEKATREKAQKQETERDKQALSVYTKLLQGGWKPIDPSKGSSEGSVVQVGKLGFLEEPPGREGELAVRMRELALKEKTAELNHILAQLKVKGAIDEAEFRALKQKWEADLYKQRVEGNKIGLSRDEIRRDIESIKRETEKIKQKRAAEGGGYRKPFKVRIGNKDVFVRPVPVRDEITGEEYYTPIEVEGKPAIGEPKPETEREIEARKARVQVTLQKLESIINSEKGTIEDKIGSIETFNRLAPRYYMYVPEKTVGKGRARRVVIPKIPGSKRLSVKELSDKAFSLQMRPEEALLKLLLAAPGPMTERRKEDIKALAKHLGIDIKNVLKGRE